MKDWLNEYKFYVLMAILMAAFGLYYFYGGDNREPAANESLSMESEFVADGKENLEPQPEEPKVPDKMMVDVKGQIKLPGVYHANAGERVIDVISRAGGLTDQADQSQVNFAAHVEDEMVIYIPAKGEEGAITPEPSGGSIASIGSSRDSQGKINLNKADENELQNLPGIGPAKAAAIIEYRNTSGPFKAVDDLKNISGIGDKTFEKLKDLVVVH